MMEIKIYAPTSGIIYPIEELDDGVFSEGLLGKGIFIIPEDNNFSGIGDEFRVQSIFDTKHALYFEKNGIYVLMHIGLDSVKLNGAPFSIKVNKNQKINKYDSIAIVDLEMLKANNISTATPIVIDLNESQNIKDIKINIKSGQRVQSGDEIMTLSIEEVDKKTLLKSQIIDFEDEYYIASQEIFNAVGKKENYSKVYNCITRLRFTIKDKDLVNINDLKKIRLVKGVNWNGEELQVIIGANVSILKDAFDKFYIDFKNGRIGSKKEKVIYKSKKDIFFTAVTSIVTPVIPILLIFGMIQGIRALFVQIGWMSASTGTDVGILSWLYSSISEVGLTFIFIAFIWSTVKYLNGNTIVAVFIGLALCNPFLLKSGNTWVWFTIDWNILGKPVEFGIVNYTNSVIPGIVAGFVYFYVDKWIKTWMPGVVDIVFRHTLAFIFTIVIMLFAFGPMSKMLEVLLSVVVISAGKIPFGIGVGLFALLYQPLVLTGMHQVVLNVLRSQLAASKPLILYTGVIIGTWGQIGAAIGVAIATRRRLVRQTATGALPAALLGGVTEPILYGVNLLRITPFICGVFASGIGGILSGILGVARWGQAPGGIFHILGYTEGGITNIINYCIVMTLTAVMATFATVFVYTDRQSEKQILKNLYSQIKKLFKKEQLFNENTLNTLNSLRINFTKDEKKVLNDYEKSLIRLQNLEIAFKNVDHKENKMKKIMSQKIAKIKDQEKIQKVLNSLVNNYDFEKYESKRNKINQKLTAQQLLNNNFKLEANKIIFNKEQLLNQNINELIHLTNIKDLEKIKNNYSNGLNSLEIEYEMYTKKDNIFDFKQNMEAIK